MSRAIHPKVHAEAEECLARVLSGNARRDPYESLGRLRQLAPVHWSETFDGWFLTRFDDCLEVIRSPLFHVALGEHLALADPRYHDSAFLQSVANILVFMNPPQHTRCRRLVGRAFSPRTVAASRIEIEALADRAIAEVVHEPEFDLHQMISRRIPGDTICHLMGIPMDDRGTLLGLVDEISDAVAPTITDDALRRADGAAKSLADYIGELADRRRALPGEDVVSALIAAEQEEGKLSHEEFVGITHTLIAGAINTAQGMLSSGALAFIENSEEAEKLRSDAGLAAPATDEVLRLQAPIQIAFQRIAIENATIRDQEIQKGDIINLMIGAANHDPEAFPPDPDRFRIDRDSRPHLTFGNGIHFCVGAAVARAEGEITFPRLFSKMPDLQLVEDAPVWRDGYMIRSQERLLVRRGGEVDG